MKKIIIGLLLVATIVFAQVHSSDAPSMFYQHQNQTYFVTNIVNLGDSAYTYQAVPIAGFGYDDILQGLLTDYPNNYEDVSFPIYYARSVERVSFAVYGTVNTAKATACGYQSGITEAEMKENLGVTNYAN